MDTSKLPGGDWIDSARNIKYENNWLTCDMPQSNGNCITWKPCRILAYVDDKLTNMEGNFHWVLKGPRHKPKLPLF